MTEYPWEKSYPEGTSWHAQITPGSINDLFDEAVKKWSARTMTDFMGKTITYGEMGRLVAKAAKGFQDLGVKPGVKVGLHLPNCPQHVISYYGILKAGGTVVNYSPLDAARELTHKIKDSNTEIIVTIDLKALYDNLSAVADSTGLSKVIVCNMSEALPFPKNLLFKLFKKAAIATVQWDHRHMHFADLLDNDGQYAAHPLGDPNDELAVIQYTGGTTGVPKGAMLSHGNLTAALQQFAAMGGEGENAFLTDGEEVTLVILPLFHVFAMTVLLLYGTTSGCTMVLHPRFDAEAALKDIEKKKITIFPGVPTMFTALYQHPNVGKYDLSSLKQCNSGGAPLPIEVQRKFESVSGARVLEGWGMTETSPSGTATPKNNDPVPGSCGIPVPQMVMKIMNLEDITQEMPSGEIGEVWVKGPNITKGYYKRPEETAEAFVDGFFRTGDTGYFNENGYLFLVDRTKDMILSSGYNVYPRVLEEAIQEHPAVREVTVIGIPDEYRGESAKAFVALMADHDEFPLDDLKGFLADKLAKYEMPTELEFRAELPKTPVGKLSKKELREEETAKRAG